MKLASLVKDKLFEGMIDVPTSMFDEVDSFVRLMTLKRCAAELEDNELVSDSEQIEGFKLLDKLAGNEAVDEYPSGFASRDSVSTSVKFKVPERYLSKYRRMHGDEQANELLKQKLTVNVVYSNPEKFTMTRSDSGLLNVVDLALSVQPSVLGIDLDFMLQTVRAHKKNLTAQVKAVESMLKQMSAVVHHELTHAIQALVLAELHSDQFITHEPHDQASVSQSDKEDIYFTQPVEFDPWVKTELARIKRILDGLPKSEHKSALRKFVCGDLTSAQAEKTKAEVDRSRFFLALRRHEQDKWKKAVKMLFTALEQEHHEAK